MDDSRNKTPFIYELFRNFAVVFLLAIFAMSFAGILFGRYENSSSGHSPGEFSILFAVNNGLSYGSIFQIAGFSLIIAFVIVLLFSEHYAVKLKFLYRLFISFSASLIAAIVFSVIFKWFPVENTAAWIGFILSFFACYLISTGITLIKLRLEKRKYRRLLEKYRAAAGSS